MGDILVSPARKREYLPYRFHTVKHKRKAKVKSYKVQSEIVHHFEL